MITNGRLSVAAVVPMQGLAADRTLAPVYPGLTDSSLARWDPPFPIDLRRVRPVDEDYWKKYPNDAKSVHPSGRRAAAVAFALRRPHVDPRHATAVNPLADDARPLRRPAARAARSAGCGIVRAGCARRRTGRVAGRDGFRGILHVFQLLPGSVGAALAGLFFRLGVEQRAREVGLLRAVGYTTAASAASSPPKDSSSRWWAGDRDGGRGRVRVGDDGRAWLVVGRRGRHRRAPAACLGDVACRRCRRRGGDCNGVHLVDACGAWRGCPSEACSRAMLAADASTVRPRTRSRCAGALRHRLRRAGTRAHRGQRGGMSSTRPAHSSARARSCSSPALCVAAVTLRRPGHRSLDGPAGGRCPASACATPPIGRAAACWRSP